MLQHDFDGAPVYLPPQAIEAESAILGGLLLDNAAWDKIGDLLTEADFYRHDHRLIFSAIGSLVNACKPADVVTVFEHLRHQGSVEDAGGIQRLNDLAQYVPSAANLRAYAERVAETAIERRMVTASDTANEIAKKPGSRAADKLNEIQNLFQQIEVRRHHGEPKAVEHLAGAMLDRISDLADGIQQPGIETGFPALDRLLGGGAKPGKQIVIAARTSVGKTALATAIAIAFARAGHGAAIFSMEMETGELMERLTASLGRIDLGNISTGRLTDEEWPRLTEAVEQLRGMPLFLHDQAAMSLHDIRSKARQLRRQHGIKLLVVDYLQLCAASDQRSGSNRHHQLEELSRGLKALAKQLGLTLVLLSQLNREVEKRTSGRPVLADLKESGAIEEDADVVILLSQDRVRTDGAAVIHAEVAKNRGGKKGFLKLAFNGAHQHWVETSDIDAPQRPAARHYTDEV
jgi:replicative DNA helicase